MQAIFNQLIYFGFFQGLLLLFIYTFSSQSRKSINAYLVVLIIVLLVGLVGKILNLTEVFGSSHRFSALSEFSIFFFGPTIYLFTQSVLNGRSFTSKDLKHYAPALIYIVTLIFYYIIPSQQLILEKVKSGELYTAVVIFMGVGLSFNIYYLILSFRVFNLFKDRIKDEASFTVKTSFFNSFLVAIGCCLVVWLVIYIIGTFGETWLERDARPFVWLCLAFIILFITYYTIRSPELFRVAYLLGKHDRKYAQSKYSRTELDLLKHQLDHLMTDKKPYLNRNLMKADLAELLGVNSPEMARLLNESIGMNFFEYVNYHRIKEFINLAETEKAKQLTFFGLAQEAGFNSKTTFNKSFKDLMGKSPKEYFADQ